MTNTGTAHRGDAGRASQAAGPRQEHPGVFPTLLYSDARAAVQQLTAGLGFTEVGVYENGGGVVIHAELAQGNGGVMIGTKGNDTFFAETMRHAGPAGVYVVVDDVDAHHRRAVQHGVEVLRPPEDQDYGSRNYLARDIEGNVWTFGTYSPQLTS